MAHAHFYSIIFGLNTMAIKYLWYGIGASSHLMEIVANVSFFSFFLNKDLSINLKQAFYLHSKKSDPHS